MAFGALSGESLLGLSEDAAMACERDLLARAAAGPGDPAVLLSLARIQLRLGRSAMAETTLIRAIESGIARPESDAALCDLLISLRRCDEAGEVLARASGGFGSPTALEWRQGRLLFAQGRLEPALKTLRAAMARRADLPVEEQLALMLDVAQCHFGLHQHEKVISIASHFRIVARDNGLSRLEERFYRLWCDATFHHMKIAERREVASRPLRVFNIELTNRCPLRCVMCARTHHMTRTEGLMDFALFRKIIDEMVEANPEESATQDVWLHHFGESLVHPEFPDFIRYARDRNVCASLSINPIMLTEKVGRALLEAGPARLYLSLDGHDDASFEQIRGLKNAYEKSKAHALRFFEMKTQMQSKTIVLLSMLDFGLNAESIARMRRFWEAVPGVDAFLCKDFVTWDGADDKVSALSQRQWDNEALAKRMGFASCPVPFETMSITWDGDVVPCCYDYDKKYILGNAARSSLQEIWNGEPMRRLRREFLDNDVRNALCRNCESVHACH